MPKKKKENKKEKSKSIEETLWDAANKLRGGVEPAEYKHIVLALIFLKYVGERFQERYDELVKEGKKKFVDKVEFYTMKNVFYLSNESRWEYIIKHSRQKDLAIKIDTALHSIEKENESLKGALPDNYFSRIALDNSKLSSLLDNINNLVTKSDETRDIFGRVYEYFLKRFAIKEGKNKGEYYTPKCIVNLIAELIEPFQGTIYDPCCGSGGMFVQSLKLIENHNGNKKNVSIYGQESTSTTLKLAKMNLAIRGISANIGDIHADTFKKDLHTNLLADYIMANPPFNQDDWRSANELVDDPRWDGYEVPPISNANYAWILHIISKLSKKGVAGFLLANGSLSGGAEEYKIRKQIIENDLIEAIITLPRDMFYATDISVTLWIINKQKNQQKNNTRSREGEILFLDLRRSGSEFEKKYIELTNKDILEISEIFKSWKNKDHKKKYKNIPEFCKSVNLEEIRKNDYSLIPSKYIEFVDKDVDLDFDKEMKKIQKKFSSLINDENDSQQELLKAFKNIGYEIKD